MYSDYSLCYELKDECEKAQKNKKMALAQKWQIALKYMMDNFETEMVVLGARIALKNQRNHPFSFSSKS